MEGLAGYALVAVLLIALTSPDGQVIWVNPAEVVSVHNPRDERHSLLTPGVNCVLFTADSKLVNVKEDCEAVHRLLGGP